MRSLCAPISEENPCGEDISYDPGFLELETLILGKPETQFAPGEPPDWKLIRKTCLGLLDRSKHLRLLVALMAAELRLEGIPGFRDGLKALSGWVETYWASLYPQLDPEDANDPTERLNIVSTLATPVGAAGDPYKIISALRSTPLARSLQAGSFSLDDFAKAQAAGPDANPSPALIDAAFHDTAPAALQELFDAVTECPTLIKTIDQQLGDAAGNAGSAPEFTRLLSTFKELRSCLEPRLPAGAAVPETPSSDDAGIQTVPASVSFGANASASRGLPGSIQTREEALRALDLVCTYYRDHEPSSPVPLLVQRAKRLAAMDFMQILSDMNPDALGLVNTIVGTS